MDTGSLEWIKDSSDLKPFDILKEPQSPIRHHMLLVLKRDEINDSRIPSITPKHYQNSVLMHSHIDLRNENNVSPACYSSKTQGRVIESDTTVARGPKQSMDCWMQQYKFPGNPDHYHP
jgi:hypothetical protein